MNERVLVADDEDVLRTNICEYLTRAGYDAECVPDGETALARVLEEDFFVVVADIRMPGLDGVALLKRIAVERPDTFVLLMTAYASVATTVEALRFGAYDYLLKPIVFEELQRKVDHLVSSRALREEVVRLRRALNARLGFEGIVGDSPSIRAVFDLAEKVAKTRSTVLLTGESGTGKELVARAIHASSALASREFLAVNIAALPREMVEAQLFGHEKGAFTGAARRRDGLLRGVRGGTIFLDEVGELPEEAQAKLLRAIDRHEVLPVGADRPIKVEFRLIAATNRDLEKSVLEGRFREDLYYRLNVFRIEMPPLRARREDLPALVCHFIELHSRALGLPPRVMGKETLRQILSYDWPGNVRELSNVLERALILAGTGAILPEHLPAELRSSQTAAPMALRPAVEDFERQHISWVLRATGGNREQAAKLLEVDPATLYRRLSKYGIS